jgi:hypothetical protein
VAQAPIPKANYPDVPPSDGVPALFRDPERIVFTIRLLEADVVSVFQLFAGPQWGVFDTSGFPVAIPDSVISVDYRKEWRVSDYPVEGGAFESYNKVSTPFDARVRMACDGSTTPRSLFLSQIDSAANSLTLYTVVTPDAQYASANITHYDYRRERESGAGILLVDVWLQEVRVTVQTQFTSTKSPEGAAAVNTGSVQPTTPSPAQSQAVALSSPT